MRSYSLLTIRTCHRRGIHAMGGMAAQIPIKNDPAANEQALEKVRQDKLREVRAGHDGTWVAHPGLVGVAREIFEAGMAGPNQIAVKRGDVRPSAGALLEVPDGQITEKGLRWNIDVGLQYLESWLRGVGCVPIYNLMEDAATAEICRAQIWQWIRHGARMTDGRQVTRAFVEQAVAEQLGRLRAELGDVRYAATRFDLAARLFEQIATGETFPEFLTLAAYEHLD